MFGIRDDKVRSKTAMLSIAVDALTKIARNHDELLRLVVDKHNSLVSDFLETKAKNEQRLTALEAQMKALWKADT